MKEIQDLDSLVKMGNMCFNIHFTDDTTLLETGNLKPCKSPQT